MGRHGIAEPGLDSPWFCTYRRPAAELSTCYADIAPEETVSIWDGKLPLRDVTLGAGEGGIGKGLWLADVVARVTIGRDMPDGSEGLCKPQNVVLVTPEDHVKRAMAWRLRAAGADLSRVFDLTRILGHDFTIPDDLPLLCREMRAIGDVALVGLDPLSQLVDKNLTGVKFVRRHVWSPLRELAEETYSAIFCMHHLTKAGSVAGSASLVQSARLQLRFGHHEMDPDLVEVKVEKANNSARGLPLYYRLEGEGHGIHIAYEEADIMPDTGRAGDNTRRVLWELTQARGEAVDYKDIARNLGLTPGNTRVILHRLASEGAVTKPSRGHYAVA